MAHRYFKEFAYVKAAALYEQIVAKGDRSIEVLSCLGDAYYFNSKTEKSEFWYQKLFELYPKANIAAEYYFRFSQSLKSNKKYRAADQWLLKFSALNTKDSRGSKHTSFHEYITTFTQQQKQVRIENLSVNSAYSDFGAFQQGEVLYFSSTRPPKGAGKKKLYSWNQQPMLNIYATQDNINIKKLTGINSIYHDASAVVTKDGKTMYFTRDDFDGRRLKRDRSKVTHLKLYTSTFQNGEWTIPVALPFNDVNYSIGHPALSTDERELYFTSDMPGGFGQTDIYKVKILADGSYGTPQNLGKNINTEGREMFPFVSEKQALFFSSDGHLGLGLLDVFTSEIHGDYYSIPVNMGVPFNSSKDDFSLTIQTDKQQGYFSSNRAGGKGDDDIYSFTISECLQTISGVAYNVKDTVVSPNTKVTLLDATGKVLKDTISDNKGKYSFASTPCNQKFTLIGAKKGFTSGTTSVTGTNVYKDTLSTSLWLTPLIVRDQIVINPIYFDFDEATIREDAAYELEKIVTVMKEFPKLVIRIESHTDARGEQEYNQKLSDRRAKASRAYILSRGIEASRIVAAQGFGESQLLNSCNDANLKKCTEAAHQENRRSYFYIVKGQENVKFSKD
jgi:outer membrane protein OmpA-like peptidoglycan-associated protein